MEFTSIALNGRISLKMDWEGCQKEVAAAFLL
jgi:hypothetical protein